MKLNSTILEEQNICYFKEHSICGEIEAREACLSINKIVSTNIDININNIEVIETEEIVSNEGQRLSGTVLIVNYTLIYNIKYINNNHKNVLYQSLKEDGNYCYVMVPKVVNNIDIKRVINNNLYNILHLIENYNIELINNKLVFSVTTLFIFYPLKSQ